MILVRVSSKVCATSSAAPPQPRPADCPAGQDPEASLSRSKSAQQRSDQARKPVNSEQDSCSWTAPGPGSLISDALDARQAHNLKVIGSNPIPATKINPVDQAVTPRLPVFFMWQCHLRTAAASYQPLPTVSDGPAIRSDLLRNSP